MPFSRQLHGAGIYAIDLLFKVSIMKNILIALDYKPSAEKVAETGYASQKP